MTLIKLTIGFLLTPLCFHLCMADETSAATTSINSREFIFTSGSSEPVTQQQSFCLPRGEQLIRVINVNNQSSNVHAEAHVQGDLSSNCASIVANLPATNKICTSIPAPTWTNPGRTNQLCNSIPSTFQFSVQYESKVVNPEAIPPQNQR
jgi:hypothetical protein